MFKYVILKSFLVYLIIIQNEFKLFESLTFNLKDLSFDLSEKENAGWRTQINLAALPSHIVKQICTTERSRMGLRSCFIIKSYRTPEIVPQLFARQLNKQPNDQSQPTNYRVPSRPENRTMACVLRCKLVPRITMRADAQCASD